MTRAKWGCHRYRLERNVEIATAVLRGCTLQSVADDHLLTRERVRQILAKLMRMAWQAASPELLEKARQLGSRYDLSVQRALAEDIIALFPKAGG